MDVTAVLLLLIGLAVGALLGVLWSRGQSSARIARLEAERASALDAADLAERAQEQLGERFKALSADALARSNAQFLELADHRFRIAGDPIRETLDKLDGRLGELERARAAAQAALTRQIDDVRNAGEQLRRETASLVSALRRPDVRGRWGEMHLRRAVEVAGLVDRCDFDTQASVSTDDGVFRPDMVVHLAGGKHVVVDAKVPLAAFLDAAETDDDAVRAERLTAHARQLRTHVDQLGGKAYWQKIQPTPEFVVLFVPGEAFLAQALEQEPGLLEYAALRKVVLATPTTLIALLRTVAYAWSQDALADGAREVFELGRELYDRLGNLGEHLDRLGRSLTGAVGAYNRTVGSLEARVLVSARRMRDLKLVEDDLTSPGQVETTARALSAPELVASAEEGNRLRSLPPIEEAAFPAVARSEGADQGEGGDGNGPPEREARADGTGHAERNAGRDPNGGEQGQSDGPVRLGEGIG
ncbi:DNA recombination protein RmuC [Uniformispora flossi]|uniref:DNA recombination protein RmuC n=1 Tax=Uniformispora flossi TaxID=3390723 RepID=UPI003C2D1F53